jgi:hypothetical protein
MTIDLSLPRLRELLQDASDCIDTAMESTFSVIEGLEAQEVGDFSERSKANRKDTGRVMLTAGLARQALANASILCDHNKLIGDARPSDCNRFSKCPLQIIIFGDIERRVPNGSQSEKVD